jgi:hypothetical protein
LPALSNTSEPVALELVTRVSKEFGFYRYAASFLHLAEDFFRQPAEDLSYVVGLEANIVIHHLLGDELASRLDGLVRFATSGLLGKESVWDNVPDRF